MNLYDWLIKWIPVKAICFVFLLLAYKLYYKIRIRYKKLVNCWFCNQNTKVPYLNKNNWNCPSCEQYNGFTKDGDYNREIIEQLDCTDDKIQKTYAVPEFKDYRNVNYNGFCDNCNENQRIKVEKLSQFEPLKEANYEHEIKLYKEQLEDLYCLCVTCNRHLSQVLRDKKKMVLGSKFLEFFNDATNKIKTNSQKLNPIKYQISYTKTLISLLLIMLAIIHFFLIIKDFIYIIRKDLGYNFSNPLAHFLLNTISYCLAIINLIKTYLLNILKYEFIQKLYMFTKTSSSLCFKYLGITLPYNIFTENTLIVSGVPLVSIILAFIYNVLDGFQLTRYTALLTIWSINATLVNSDLGDGEVLKLITSLITIILSIPQLKLTKKTAKIDTSESSFHKIYSSYLTDNDETSIHDQNSSISSTKSSNFFNNSYGYKNPLNPPMNYRTSSTTNLSRILQPSPFKHYLHNNQLPQHNFNHSRDRFTPIPQYSSSYHPMYRSQSIFSLRTTNSFCQNRLRSLSVFSDREHNDLSINTKNLSPIVPSQTFRSLAYENNTNFPNHLTPIRTTEQSRRGVDTMLHSPFSYSNISLCWNRRLNSSNFLSPSRFHSSSNDLFSSQQSWLSGGFNHIQPKNTFTDRPYNFLKNNSLLITPRQQPPPSEKILINPENLSRASSQSSGFESQDSSNQNTIINHNNTSTCTGFMNNKSDLLGNRNLFQLPSSQPVNLFTSNDFSNFNQHKYNSNQHNHNLIKPVPINCTGDNLETIDWRQKSTPDLTKTDTFNFNQITGELPNLQPGSLLKAWKENNITNNSGT